MRLGKKDHEKIKADLWWWNIWIFFDPELDQAVFSVKATNGDNLGGEDFDHRHQLPARRI